MTILEKLSFSDRTRAPMLTSPAAKPRGKMLETLDLQIEAAKAMLNGATFIHRVVRSSRPKISGSTIEGGRAP